MILLCHHPSFIIIHLPLLVSTMVYCCFICFALCHIVLHCVVCIVVLYCCFVLLFCVVVLVVVTDVQLSLLSCCIVVFFSLCCSSCSCCLLLLSVVCHQHLLLCHRPLFIIIHLPLLLAITVYCCFVCFALCQVVLHWIAPRIMRLFRIYLHYISFALHLHFIYISHSSQNRYICINISKCQINVK